MLEFRRRGTENISPNLMQCPELWAVAKDIIQELTFLARENCRVKSFFFDFENQHLLPAHSPGRGTRLKSLIILTNRAATESPIESQSPRCRAQFPSEPPPVLLSPVRVNRGISTAHRSPHVRFLGCSERDPFLLPICSAAHESGVASVSFPDHE